MTLYRVTEFVEFVGLVQTGSRLETETRKLIVSGPGRYVVLDLTSPQRMISNPSRHIIGAPWIKSSQSILSTGITTSPNKTTTIFVWNANDSTLSMHDSIAVNMYGWGQTSLMYLTT
jgi:hypothetical protein